MVLRRCVRVGETEEECGQSYRYKSVIRVQTPAFLERLILY
jgi:hypothetical protein